MGDLWSFVLDALRLLSRSKFRPSPLSQRNGGPLPDAQGSVVDSISTSKLELILQRETPDGKAILGRITECGRFVCYSLEGPTVAIPPGVYSVEMTYSPEFHRPLPLLDGVPGRSCIRIHPGNTTVDTKGCILVGNQHIGVTLGDSRVASDALNDLIQKAITEGRAVTIQILE